MAKDVVAKKKLIEVALPLDEINKASAREKSIRHGHPSTLHLWWARRPLAAARAVIFAQMVDDPSANPDLFQSEQAQEKQRQRLFRIIEDLVKWENTANEEVLQRARNEIWQSWRRACADNADHPRAKELFDRQVLPAFHDPFAGGGSLPLEAQRLGLEAHASDLNPVAVLINKAMIEIPPKFAGRPPVNPKARAEERLIDKDWIGAEGLAEDVRFYGRWMRDEAQKRVGHMYPKVRVIAEMTKERPDLLPYVGRELTVIAWLWARTVKSPNPPFADIDVPLVSTFILSKKKGRGAYVEPVMDNGGYRFKVKVGSPPQSAKNGTSAGKRRAFRCLISDIAIPYGYIRTEGKAGRMGTKLMAIVAKGDRGRVYLSPSPRHDTFARMAKPTWKPEIEMPKKHRNFQGPVYGLDTLGDLFTDRQLVALTTFSDLVAEARDRVQRHAVAADTPDDGELLRDGGTGASAYAEAVGVYLAFAQSKCCNRNTSLCLWEHRMDRLVATFGRQALPMVWDFAETNPFAGAGGDIFGSVKSVCEVIQKQFRQTIPAVASQHDALDQNALSGRVVSTDPPYYDNIGYADLSDFFYVWLRRSLRNVFPDLFATMAVPKAAELIASAYRYGSKEAAEAFFLNGMTQALRQLACRAHPGFPVTIYYAFKQSENKGRTGTTSTGWETFLESVSESGFSITGTWPIRTEQPKGLRAFDQNALASSILLVCRRRPADVPAATRRELQEALRTELPRALADLQRSNIAPVDLAQASIGPGMAIFTHYSEVLNADGNPMSVGDALALINATLDEVLAEQEGDFDSDTRWALSWFEQHGFTEGEYGVAEQLSKAKNTSVAGLVQGGLIKSQRGRVRLFQPSELDSDWNPTTDYRLTVWDMTHHLIRLLGDGEDKAAELAADLGSRAETARDLAYRLYTISERKRRAADALQYNSLVQSWHEIVRLAGEKRTAVRQGTFALDEA